MKVFRKKKKKNSNHTIEFLRPWSELRLNVNLIIYVSTTNLEAKFGIKCDMLYMTNYVEKEQIKWAVA